MTMGLFWNVITITSAVFSRAKRWIEETCRLCKSFVCDEVNSEMVTGRETGNGFVRSFLNFFFSFQENFLVMKIKCKKKLLQKNGFSSTPGSSNAFKNVNHFISEFLVLAVTFCVQTRKSFDD